MRSDCKHIPFVSCVRNEAKKCAQFFPNGRFESSTFQAHTHTHAPATTKAKNANMYRSVARRYWILSPNRCLIFSVYKYFNNVKKRWTKKNEEKKHELSEFVASGKCAEWNEVASICYFESSSSFSIWISIKLKAIGIISISLHHRGNLANLIGSWTKKKQDFVDILNVIGLKQMKISSKTNLL